MDKYNPLLKAVYSAREFKVKAREQIAKKGGQIGTELVQVNVYLPGANGLSNDGIKISSTPQQSEAQDIQSTAKETDKVKDKKKDSKEEKKEEKKMEKKEEVPNELLQRAPPLTLGKMQLPPGSYPGPSMSLEVFEHAIKKTKVRSEIVKIAGIETLGDIRTIVPNSNWTAVRMSGEKFMATVSTVQFPSVLQDMTEIPYGSLLVKYSGSRFAIQG